MIDYNLSYITFKFKKNVKIKKVECNMCYAGVDYEKTAKMCAFLVDAQCMGYRLGDAWELLKLSIVGEVIVATAEEADKLYGEKIAKGEPLKPCEFRMELLADFIEMAHIRFGLPYDSIFAKCGGIEEFMANYGVALGDYDDKLVKIYLM